MYVPSRQYWYGKGGDITHIIEDIGISDVRRCGVIKMLMGIDQCIQYEIVYVLKYSRTNIGKPCIIHINSTKSNIMAHHI